MPEVSWRTSGLGGWDALALLVLQPERQSAAGEEKRERRAVLVHEGLGPAGGRRLR